MGEAIATRFAQEGARFVAAEVAPTRGQSTVDVIRKFAGEAVFVQTDVSSEPQVKAAVLISYET